MYNLGIISCLASIYSLGYITFVGLNERIPYMRLFISEKMQSYELSSSDSSEELEFWRQIFFPEEICEEEDNNVPDKQKKKKRRGSRTVKTREFYDNTPWMLAIHDPLIREPTSRIARLFRRRFRLPFLRDC